MIKGTAISQRIFLGLPTMHFFRLIFPWVEVRPQKKKTILRAWLTQFPIFPLWGRVFFFFFFFNLLKSCKYSHFEPKSRKIWLKFFWKSGLLRIFFKKFSPKSITFFEIYVDFKGVSFATKKKKNVKKMSRPTNPTWKVCPPIKQLVSFFHGLLYNATTGNVQCNEHLGKGAEYFLTEKLGKIFRKWEKMD